MRLVQVEFKVNGREINLSSRPNRTLLEILRDDLGLTGVKDGCGGEGECGACTVNMDGDPINSCLVFIGQANGHYIETIEELSRDGELHPLQSAFIEAGAVQCGYCIPGAIMSAKALLDRNPHPRDHEIREALSGNLCRCTGYTKMIEAVHMATREVVKS